MILTQFPLKKGEIPANENLQLDGGHYDLIMPSDFAHLANLESNNNPSENALTIQF